VRIRTALIGLLAIGLLAWFLRHAKIADVWMEVRRGRVDLMFATLASVLVTYVLRAVRWQYLLRPLGHARFGPAFRATVIGFAASSLLPARAGEVLRPYVVARREGFSATAAFATVILERLLDTLTVLLLFGWFVIVFDPQSTGTDLATYEVVKRGGLVVGAAAVVGLMLFFFLAGHPAALTAFAMKADRILPARAARAVATLLGTFAEGLAVVRQPQRLFVAVLLSIPLWLSIAVGIWWATLAFHISIPFVGSFLLTTVLVVGVAVPTPGAVGGFHEAYRIGTTAFYGAPNDSAIGAAIVLHAMTILPVVLLGMVFMTQDGLTLSRVGSLTRDVPTKGGTA
jgi:uncharacterized protein (TIRG00374 family)